MLLKTNDNVYKPTLIFSWLFTRLKKMSQKNEVRHRSHCQITAKTTVTTAGDNVPNVPSQKRKEEAKKTLYLNRI